MLKKLKFYYYSNFIVVILVLQLMSLPFYGAIGNLSHIERAAYGHSTPIYYGSSLTHSYGHTSLSVSPPRKFNSSTMTSNSLVERTCPFPSEFASTVRG